MGSAVMRMIFMMFEKDSPFVECVSTYEDDDDHDDDDV